MQIKIFTISILADDRDMEELNRFLRANRVVDIKKSLAMVDGNSYWTVFITYMPDKNSSPGDGERGDKVDYREVLDPDTFARFDKMRKLRKMLYERDGVPPYSVFTNAELAEIAKLKVLDMANILKIKGIGKKRVEKYGAEFCSANFDEIGNEESGWADGADSGA